MGKIIREQSGIVKAYYAMFMAANLVLMLFYLSNTLIHFTTPRQFPVNSFIEFPLTILIFPAELFSFLFAIYFGYVLFAGSRRQAAPEPMKNKKETPIAVLLPVYNEPADVVESTVTACKNLRWPGAVNIYLLDDSTTDRHKSEIRDIGKRHRCEVVRRPDRKGYKAGNLNNAVREVVEEDYFAVFDSDQAPEPDFLERTMDYFTDPDVGFVQTPQYFTNEGTYLERTAKVGANIFFHGMCKGRAADGAMVFCGTNAVIRKKAFENVNGFSYYTSTEDIDLGLRMNDIGYHGVYVPEILVHGTAPRDFKAYGSQQYRWANGNLAILRENWKMLLGGRFTFRQQMHHFFVLGWWMVGIVTLIYVLVPLLSLAFGLPTHHTWLPGWMIAWLYINVVLGVGMIYASLRERLDGKEERVRLRDAMLQYSLIVNSMFIYARAAIAALFKRYAGFIRTSKRKSSSGIRYVKWNLALAFLCFAASVYALFMGVRAVAWIQVRTYIPLSIWLLFYAVLLSSSILFVGKSREGRESKESNETSTADGKAMARVPAAGRVMKGRKEVTS